MRRGLLPALLILLAGCDNIRQQRGARQTCDLGKSMIERSIAAQRQGTVTLQERIQIRADLTEGIQLLRAGIAQHPEKGLFFDPQPYRLLRVQAVAAQEDTRFWSKLKSEP